MYVTFVKRVQHHVNTNIDEVAFGSGDPTVTTAATGANMVVSRKGLGRSLKATRSPLGTGGAVERGRSVPQCIRGATVDRPALTGKAW